MSHLTNWCSFKTLKNREIRTKCGLCPEDVILCVDSTSNCTYFYHGKLFRSG